MILRRSSSWDSERSWDSEDSEIQENIIVPARLDLTGINVFHNTGIFPQLRSISISECLGDTDPPLGPATLLGALHSMENVEQLVLYRVGVNDLGTPLSCASLGTTLLRNLRTIKLHVDDLLLKRIFSVVAVPPEATAVDFGVPAISDENGGHILNISAALPSDRRRCLPVLSQVVEAHITISDDAQYTLQAYTQLMRTRSGTPGIAFTLELDDASAADIQEAAAVGLREFGDILRDAPLEAALIEVTAPAAASADWKAFFAAFPKLRSFSLIVPGEDDCSLTAASLFELLDPGSHPAGDVLCPDLQCVCVHGLLATPRTLPKIVETCLKGRRRRLGTVGGVALDELELCLVGHDGEADFDAASRAFERRVAPLVGSFDYEENELW